MNGDERVVERVGIGIFHGGGINSVAFGALPRGGAGGESGAGGDEGGGIRRQPAFGLEGREVGGALQTGDDDVGAAENGGEVVRFVNADLELLVQLHGLAFEGEAGGAPRLGHPFFDLDQIGGLRGGEVAETAFFGFLRGHIGGDFAQQGDGGGNLTGRQARGDFRMGLGGANYEVAVVGQGADGEVEVMVYKYLGVHVFRVYLLQTSVYQRLVKLALPSNTTEEPCRNSEERSSKPEEVCGKPEE